MYDSGYIRIHRKILEWGWFKNSKTFHLFLYLLLNANYKDSKFMGYKIKRGDVIFGRLKTAENTGISERSIRTALNHLKSTSEVTIKTTNKFSIITVCNYEKYQFPVDTIDYQNDQVPDQQVTSNRPASDQQPTTSRESNKGNKKKKVIIYTSDFLSFWENFPRKEGGKGKAFELWLKIPDDKKVIIESTKKYLEHCKKIGKEIQYIPHPTTWLNQRRWEDDLILPEKNTYNKNKQQNEYPENNIIPILKLE